MHEICTHIRTHTLQKAQSGKSFCVWWCSPKIIIYDVTIMTSDDKYLLLFSCLRQQHHYLSQSIRENTYKSEKASRTKERKKNPKLSGTQETFVIFYCTHHKRTHLTNESENDIETKGEQTKNKQQLESECAQAVLSIRRSCK